MEDFFAICLRVLKISEEISRKVVFHLKRSATVYKRYRPIFSFEEYDLWWIARWEIQVVLFHICFSYGSSELLLIMQIWWDANFSDK